MKELEFGIYGKCIQLGSGKFKIYVTTEFGPRVIGGFIDGSDNIFANFPKTPFENVDTGFILYGGHRLWISPEVMPRTYAADNNRVEVTEHDDSIEFTANIEEESGLQKSIKIIPLENEKFKLIHKITNRNNWDVELAPWALSVMAPGGKAIIPQSRDKDRSPFVPDHNIMAWPYTDLKDKRLKIGNKYLILEQNSDTKSPCKIGINDEDGWIAYLNADKALVKYFPCFLDGEYPDNGCSVESYLCADFCEIETVGPLYQLAHGESAEHEEVWHGLSGIGNLDDDASINKNLIPHIATQ